MFPNCFNSRPREGRTTNTYGFVAIWCASTHAPTYGGERQILAGYVGQLLPSTHALVWGRTRDERKSTARLQTASTHAPVWGRTTPRHSTLELLSAPTHAPVWGRTACFPNSGLRGGAPTHAPVWGRTSKTLGKRLTNTRLQLTPPCGGEQQNCTNSNFPNKNITERLTTSLLFALRRSIQSISFSKNYRFLRCEAA